MLDEMCSRRLTQSPLTPQADGDSSFFLVISALSLGGWEWLRWNRGDLTRWLHSDDQVSTGLRNSKVCKTILVLETVYLPRVFTTLYIGYIKVNSLSHKDLSFSGIRVTGETSCDALHKLSATATHDLSLLECKIFNSMVVRVPTHVSTLRGHLFYGCPKY